MIRINPIKLNNYNNQISFREGNLNNITPDVAILSLQTPNAKINFENDASRTQKADVVQSPSLVEAFGAKIRKAYDILFSPNYDRVEQRHISYMG